MRSLVLFTMCALVFGACVDTPVSHGTPSTNDTNWVGEVRMTAGDTTIRLCGTGRTFKLSGPDMDTLSYRYVHARMSSGQLMKVWCYGHIGAVTRNGLVDSTLFAVKFQHLDASLRCDPIPDARVSGDWQLNDPDPLHPREIHLHLFGDGTALMITDLRNGQPALEEDGTWGVDADHVVNVTWPQRQQTMLFTWTGETLMNTNGVPGKQISLRKLGQADRSAGAFGRAAHWLAATANAQGHAVKPEDLRPSSAIAELFPTIAAQEALKAQALDTFTVHQRNGTLHLEAMKTVRDYALLLRATARR